MEPFGVLEYQIDYPLFLKFYKFHARNGYRKFLSLFIYIFLFVGIVVSGLYLLICPGLRMLVYFVLFLIILGFKVYLDLFLPKLAFKNSRLLSEATQKVRLFPDHFIAESCGENSSGQSTTKYIALRKAYELKDMFALYITQHQAFLLPKSAMSEETSKQLGTVLFTHLGPKFILVRQR